MARPVASTPTIAPYLRGSSISLTVAYRGVKYQTPVVVKGVQASQLAKNGYLNTTYPNYIEANEALATATTYLQNAIALIAPSELSTATIRANYLRLQSEAVEAKETATKQAARKARMIADVKNIDANYSLPAIEEQIEELKALLLAKEKERDNIKKFLGLYVDDSLIKLLQDYTETRKSLTTKNTKQSFNSFIATVKRFDATAKINEVGEGWLNRFQDWLLITPSQKPIYATPSINGKRTKGELLYYKEGAPCKNSTVESYTQHIKTVLKYYEARPELLPAECKVNETYKRYEFNLSAREDNVVALEEVELFNLYQFQLNQIWGKRERQKEMAIDVLLFLCATSLRFSDLKKVVPATVKDGRIMLTAKKTKKYAIKVNIPLNPISSAILAKYKDDMNNITIAYSKINRSIREVLNENANLFPTLQVLEAVTRPSGNEDDNNKPEYIKRADLIGTHSGRRTYVNICLDYQVPLNKIMGATGHTNVNTLMIYANKRKDVNKYMANTFQFNPTEKEVYQLPETVEATEY